MYLEQERNEFLHHCYPGSSTDDGDVYDCDENDYNDDDDYDNI